MRRLPIFPMLSVAFALSGAALAHEGHSHGTKLMGTVAAVHTDAGRVELTTKDGKTTDFYVSPATRYLKGATNVSLADLKPGMRVVVDTKVDGQKTMATTVKVGGSPKPPKGIAPPQ